MADPDFMLTDEERRLKARRRRIIFLSILSSGALIAAIVFGGRPALNQIKAWQAQRHAQKAFAFIAQEKWNDARGEAIAAYQLRPTEPQALRAVARFLSRTRQPDALEFWKQLQDRQPLTREDLRDEAAIALAAGDNPRAEAAVHQLLASNPEPADWLLAAQLSIQKGAPEEARQSLEKIGDRASEREQFQAALLALATSANADQANAAWSRVEKISRGQSLIALDALIVLARRELTQVESKKEKVENKFRDAQDLAHALESHPLAKAPQKLLALDLLEHLDVSQREKLIERAIAEFQNADNDSLAALAAWLNGKGEYQRELDTIPLARALQARDLFLQHVDALGALGRWSEIKTLLSSERYPLEPVVQFMYLARCNAQLGEKTAAQNNWQRARELAGGDSGKLLTLAEYAEKNGALDVAGAAYEAAANEMPKLRPAQQGRLRLAQMSGDTKKIHDVLADMLRIWPNDAAVQNDEAYTRLLLITSQQSEVESAKDKVEWSERDKRHAGANARVAESEAGAERKQNDEPSTSNPQLSTVREIEALAENLLQREPASLPHRTLLALARLKQNRANDALAVYENIQVAPSALTPSALAVHAAVLAANGKIDDARAEAAQIQRDQLLPEEKALLPPN